ncbi:MAG: fibrobacter succinogenes major paralogous domain-containing protein [Thermodesulfobacteriota bacterium]|nr:fibrobacter succinogenes major paralogous domain-containing protein [Thermodesulfobacteriota bacterium]
MKIYNILLMSLVTVVLICGLSWNFWIKDGEKRETDTVTDIDGNAYLIIKIGEQWWMAENLKVTRYRNGDPIPNVTDENAWHNLKTGGYCSYDNDASKAEIYGYLYNWYAVKDPRGLAPEGWHVPSDNEWQTLVDYLGGNGVAGGKMKETGTAHWTSPNAGATNESGFSALPGGYRSYCGVLGSFGRGCGDDYCDANFWSSTESSTEDGRYGAWHRVLYCNALEVHREDVYKQYGNSVRCVRD